MCVSNNNKYFNITQGGNAGLPGEIGSPSYNFNSALHPSCASSVSSEAQGGSQDVGGAGAITSVGNGGQGGAYDSQNVTYKTSGLPNDSSAKSGQGGKGWRGGGGGSGGSGGGGIYLFITITVVIAI